MKRFSDSPIARMVPLWKPRPRPSWFGIWDIRVVTAPYFFATKIEAFKDRRRRDFWASHDLEDLIFLIDGRSIVEEALKAIASF